MSHLLVAQSLEASLAAAMPGWHVQRKLCDPGTETKDRLQAGVLCIVSTGGGEFANWSGREGELGTMDLTVVGFKQLYGKDKTSQDAEDAELELLAELLSWTGQQFADPITAIKPGRYRQSQQLAFPIAWLSLDLKVECV